MFHVFHARMVIWAIPCHHVVVFNKRWMIQNFVVLFSWQDWLNQARQQSASCLFNYGEFKCKCVHAGGRINEAGGIDEAGGINEAEGINETGTICSLIWIWSAYQVLWIFGYCLLIIPGHSWLFLAYFHLGYFRFMVWWFNPGYHMIGFSHAWQNVLSWTTNCNFKLT